MNFLCVLYGLNFGRGRHPDARLGLGLWRSSLTMELPSGGGGVVGDVHHPAVAPMLSASGGPWTTTKDGPIGYNNNESSEKTPYINIHISVVQNDVLNRKQSLSLCLLLSTFIMFEMGVDPFIIARQSLAAFLCCGHGPDPIWAKNTHLDPLLTLFQASNPCDVNPL
jgi:hypothetical protein